MELWIGALNLGILYSFMTMGVFITFRVHDFPDITVDGSFTTGAAVAAVLMVSGTNPLVALLIAFCAGALAGSITALIHTRLQINGLLAGILVMTGLYSINLHIMGRSNIPLLNETTLFTWLERVNPGVHQEVWITLALLGIVGLFWLAMSLFFKTDMGVAMRVTGNNPDMAAAAGIHVNRMTVFGVALANGLVGVSGALIAQYQGFADIGMGIGTIVIGLAAVIIGESVLRKRSMAVIVLSVIVGSVIFRLMIAVALYVGMNPIDLKLLTAAFVLATLMVSKRIGGTGRKRRYPWLAWVYRIFTVRRVALGLVGIGAILLGASLLKNTLYGPPTSPAKASIGVVQVVDHGLLNITRDSFVEEMKRLGYPTSGSFQILCENANGDLATVNTILDKFLQQDVDVVVPISTACTQVAVNKVKDRPVVFATVANPFIIGAGKSETVHLPNVTGVYGWVPMKQTLDIVQQLIPGDITIGAIWDPAHANSVFNVENLKRAADAAGNVTFMGATIANSSEVYDAARALVSKGIDAFVLAPDNIVYSAFESVVKAARAKKAPIFMSDVGRLAEGALATLGYDYTQSGIQAARLVDRILKGEDPRNIPFERYRKIEFGLNLEAAKDLGITIPNDLLAKATRIHGLTASGRKVPRIGVVQFALEPNVELCKDGIRKALADNGYVDGKNVKIIYKNAQADFSMINAIIQDFLRRKVDIIVPLSTPCVQSAVQLTRGKPDTTVAFTYIFDPYRIGAAKTPEDHPPNMTGVSCPPPIEKMLDLIKEMFPERKKIGIVWNSSEANSEAILSRIRPHAADIGLEIVEATVTNPSEVLDASRSLAAKGAEVFLNAGDNTLNVSFDSFAKVADENQIPLFSVDSELIDKSLVAFGPDYFQTGYDGGTYLARILKGEQQPADLPIHATTKTSLLINMRIARKQGFTIDKQVLERADRIIEKERGLSPADHGRKKRAALFMFSDHDALLQTARGVREQLKKSGILDKYHMTVDTKSAQNEFYLAQSIAQDIVRQKYDLVITLSTPILQIMGRTNDTIPHIFGAVTDPYQTGVVKGPRDHPAHITGVATCEPVDTTIKIMRELMPGARRIGMIWNPAEACSEVCTLKARKAASENGFELVESTVSSPAEISDALRSLLSKGIDIFYTSGDNTVASVQKTINQVMKKAKIPVFTNIPTDVTSGALVSVGADFYDVGQEIGRMAGRVIKGESPADIPIESFAPEKIWVNAGLAKAYGITLPPTFMDRVSRTVNGP